MGAGIEPRIAAAEPLDMKLATFEIPLIEAVIRVRPAEGSFGAPHRPRARRKDKVR